MTNTKHREKFDCLDTQIWKRTCINCKGQTTLPQKLRQILGIKGKDTVVLWISAKRKNGKSNEFLLEIAVKKTMTSIY